jgi:antirestriction protein ArdC
MSQENMTAPGEATGQGTGISFRVSREVQEDFVDGFLAEITALTKYSKGFQENWQPEPAGVPYNPVTGASFSGANMARLLMEEARCGYGDDRWLTLKQLDEVRKENPNTYMKLRGGEHGVKLLRAEQVYFMVSGDDTWKPLARHEIDNVPPGAELKRATVFYPYTVFNATQIAGFPAKQERQPALTEHELETQIFDFAACTGVRIDRTGDTASYSPHDDTLHLPENSPLADKLTAVFEATGHMARENRPCTEETTRCFLVTLLAATALGVKPVPLTRV